MTTSTADQAMIDGSPSRQFARFAIPTIIGMLAISSASIVDGIFVGKYVGATALASVNLIIPLMSLVFGLLIMMSVGSAAIAGKFLGQRRFRRASDIFTKTMIVVCVLLSLITISVLAFPDQIVSLLGAGPETAGDSAAYLWTIAWFFPAYGILQLLNQFLRIDERPGYAVLGLIGISVGNILLDVLFIGFWGWGIEGAALATGLSSLIGALFLALPFLMARTRLTFTRPMGSWHVMARAAFNGFSEFLNETSGGLIMFLFNWILITQLGAMGVAAFTIVSYLFFIGILIFYGVSEALIPLISTNFGARKPERISAFLKRAVGLNLVIGLILSAILLLGSEQLIKLFLGDGEGEILALSQTIILILWPSFLFSGISIALSGYFTGMQCARQSALIALSRSLVLPVLLMGLLWSLFGYVGAFYAIPVAEGITMLLAFVLFRNQRQQAKAIIDNQLAKSNACVA